MYPHHTIHKQFFLRWLTLLCGMVMLIWGWPVAVSSQDYDDPCADFEMAFVDVDTLPGVFVITYPSYTEFALLDGATGQIITNDMWSDDLYLTMSPDRRWLITWEAIGYNQRRDRIWMHDLNGEREPLLLVESPQYSAPPFRYYGAGSGWVDSETIHVGWSERENVNMAVQIRPFDEPIRYIPIQLDIGDGAFRSYSPDSRRVLGQVMYQQNGYFIYDLPTGEIEFLPGRELPGVMQLGPIPAWSPDGRLAYAAPTVYLDNYNRYSEEWFVRDFDNGTNDQISNLLDEFGGVDIATDMIWSPDGRHIAFMLRRFEVSLHEPTLFVMNTYNGDVTPTCVQPDNYQQALNFFFWSPDSNYIAFLYEDNLVAFNIETRTFSLIMSDVLDLLDWR